MEEHAEGLVCLSGCARDGALAGAFERGDTARRRAARRRLLAAFGRERFRVELQRPYWRHDRARNRWLALLAERLGVPCVATGNVHSHDRRRAPLQDAFVAIGLGETLEESEPLPPRQPQLGPRLAGGDGGPLRRAPGGGRRDRAPRRAAALRPHRASSATATPAARTPAPTASSPSSAATGSASATPAAPAAEAEGRLEEELATIRQLGLSGFFLLHHDLLELAREVAVEVRGPDSARAVLPPGRGRGSSVSSIVCYLTGLSHVDPVEADLFSGRFLNEEATSMPDIDLDFPRDIREVLIPRVHERYGADRSALVAAFPTYRPRGVVRDLGKALGLPPAEIDKVAKTVGFHETSGEIERDAGRRARRRARRRSRAGGRCCGSPRRRWACPATPPSTPAGW